MTAPAGPDAPRLDGRRVLLIVSGGIAAFKALELVRLITAAGGTVRCVLTEAGAQFVTPLSLQALSGNKVHDTLWSLTDESEMGHIALSRSADLLVVCPASADILARMAAGLASDLATTLLLATDTPVLAAPAMNVRMWLHPATQANLATLRARGIAFVGPDEGVMACNEFGPGRLAEPPVILRAIADALGTMGAGPVVGVGTGAVERPAPDAVGAGRTAGAEPAPSFAEDQTGTAPVIGAGTEAVRRTATDRIAPEQITGTEPTASSAGGLPGTAPVVGAGTGAVGRPAPDGVARGPITATRPAAPFAGGTAITAPVIDAATGAVGRPPAEAITPGGTIATEPAASAAGGHAAIDRADAGMFSAGGSGPAAGSAPGLAGRHALVTAGPTHEPIDPVRFIANRSSGRQGYAIAAALAARGARVTLVSGPTALPAPPGVIRVAVETAVEMLAACKASLPADIAVLAAAVADWRAETPAPAKLKKRPGAPPPPLALVFNPDILALLSAPGPDRPRLVVGFAAETEDLLVHAAAKLARKGCDWIVANDVADGTGIMGGADNEVHLLTHEGAEHWPRLPKQAVADRLVDRIALVLAHPENVAGADIGAAPETIAARRA